MERSGAGEVTGTVGVKKRVRCEQALWPPDRMWVPRARRGIGKVLSSWLGLRGGNEGSGGGQREIFGTVRLPGCYGCRLTQAGEQEKKVGDRRQTEQKIPTIGLNPRSGSAALWLGSLRVSIPTGKMSKSTIQIET